MYCFFASGLPYLQWLQKGLNLCIFDMFDHTCSGLKKSKFLQMDFVHIWFSFSYVVYHTYSHWKRSKFVLFLTCFDHTCSGQKSLNFYVQMFQEFVPILMGSFSPCRFTIPTVVGKRSKFVYFSHVWPYLQWSENVLNF